MAGSGTLAEAAALFKKYVGYREGANNSNAFSNGLGRPPEPWCADFVEDIFRIAGVPRIATSAYTPTAADQYKRAGRWTISPRAGDQGFVYSPQAGRIIHTFWVWSVSGGYVNTIEGNTNNDGSANGNGVYRRVRPKLKSPGYAGVIGYGRPTYKAAHVVVAGAPVRLFLSRYLAVGNSGLAVKNLQIALNRVLRRYTVKVDGDFGPLTERSVKWFQRDVGLPQDGVVGPKTARALGWTWVG